MLERSKVLGWIRLAAVYVFIAWLVIASRPTPALVAAGATIALVGEAVRLWAAGHLVKSTRLITSGPYAYTQNPLYLGRLLILTGLGIAARTEGYLNLAALAAGYAVFFLYYLPRKERVEGRRLLLRHGAIYEDYRAAVPALVPGRRRFAGPRVSWSLELVVRSGEPLLLAGLVVLFGLLAMKVAAR